MDDFLAYAEEKNASDLHISTGYPPMLRVDGKLISIGNQIMQLERVRELFESILTPEQQEALKADLDIDFSHSIQSGTRFRVNIYHKKEQLAGAFRLIPSRIRTIAELGLPDVIYDFAKLPHGLVLVTGPTGHGKSTTLASIIQEININEAKHIITIEDPIEYVFPRAKSLVDQREVGTDVKSFSRALRAALREDPDVVLVGEMRDFETIASAITVAETGHLVFSTLHTNSAAQSIDRMIDVFPDAQQAQIRAQLANVISAVVAQRLVPVQRGGRKAVLEIMIANAAIKNAIREGKTYQIDNMIQTSAELGMITLEKSLVKLIRSGDLTVEAAQNYTAKPDELLSLLKSN
ncbi:MAG: type IV pilus twitching motility protein PilT [Candidatus Dojkabacteria bacterium]|nr:type IV pilus twitching motility protein PilT [Candidatus Dojkabacteria bacterium]WKZ28496.1 MAG: type IV pilus twitching motility protein PilT [Candidatus Dojkabacteria bacterium]